MVSGDKNGKNKSIFCSMLPVYKLNITRGNGLCVISLAGEIYPFADCQNFVMTNSSRHHLRQRRQVDSRTTIPKCFSINAMRRLLIPHAMIEIKINNGAGYHLRPKNRTDGGVVRLRQLEQQKLMR